VVTGDAEAVERVEDLLVDRERVTARGCGADPTHGLLTSEPGEQVAYTYFADARRCDAVPLIAVDYVSDGMLVEATRSGRTTS
jgi:hypothetical protein